MPWGIETLTATQDIAAATTSDDEIEPQRNTSRDVSVALRSKRTGILQEVSIRPWSAQENRTILQFVSDGQGESLSTILLGRD
jgi:hypothetical protein